MELDIGEFLEIIPLTKTFLLIDALVDVEH